MFDAPHLPPYSTLPLLYALTCQQTKGQEKPDTASLPHILKRD